MKRSSADLLLLLAALIWGTTFVAQSLGMNRVGPFTFTAVRFLLGSLAILPMARREYLALHARGKRIGREDLMCWIGLGLVLCMGVNLQQIGLITTTVTNAGFLTALYVPLVPILGWLIYRESVALTVWPSILGCVLGVFLLSGAKLSAFARGDYWVLASTIFWAVHVLWIGRVADRLGTPVMVAFTQFVVCGLLSAVPAVLGEAATTTLSGFLAAMPAILYGGLLSVGIAYTLQVVAQRHTQPTDAAILLSSEELFAAIAGAIVLGERLSLVQLTGGLLIFASIVAVQIVPWKPKVHQV